MIFSEIEVRRYEIVYALYILITSLVINMKVSKRKCHHEKLLTARLRIVKSMVDILASGWVLKRSEERRVGKEC